MASNTNSSKIGILSLLCFTVIVAVSGETYMEWVKEVTQLASSIAPFSDPTICDDPFKCDEDTIIPDTICGKLAKRNQIRSQCNYCANECILTKLGQKFPKIIVGKNVELKKPSDFKLYTTAGNGLRIYIANNTSGS